MGKFGYVKKMDNGKYLLRLSLGFDEFGKRIQPSRVVEAKSDRDADKQLMDFYNERDKLMQEHASHIPNTLEELYNEWMKNHVEASLRNDTIMFYKSYWEKYVKQFGKAKLKTFSPKMVSQIIGKLEKESRTRKGVYGMLKAMFNKAKKCTRTMN
jgi:translation initiation factor 2 alpha subunit (eIF-2alpha)